MSIDVNEALEFLSNLAESLKPTNKTDEDQPTNTDSKTATSTSSNKLQPKILLSSRSPRIKKNLSQNPFTINTQRSSYKEKTMRNEKLST